MVFDVGGFASWWFRKRNHASKLVGNYLEVGGNFTTFFAFLLEWRLIATSQHVFLIVMMLKFHQLGLASIFNQFEMTGIETSHDKMKTPSGHLGKHRCLEVGGFDVGGGFWVPIIHQHRGIPVLAKLKLSRVYKIILYYTKKHY